MTREDYINALELDNAELKKENQKLKEELEDMTLCRDIASGHRQEVQNRETLLLRHQERFIKYLEEETEEVEKTIELLSDTNSCRIPNLKYKENTLKEILQKYKEIIGVK